MGDQVMTAALKQGGSVEAAADLLLEGFTGAGQDDDPDKPTDDSAGNRSAVPTPWNAQPIPNPSIYTCFWTC